MESKKMNLSAIEDRLSVYEMQEIQAGSFNWACAGAICTVVAAAGVGYTPFGCVVVISGACGIMASC